VAEDEESCEFCGGPVGDNWLGLEVQRPVFVNGEQRDVPDYLTDRIFCSQDHASKWLAGPLPEPEPLGPSSRLGAWLGRAGVVLLLLLLGVGVVTTVWVGGAWLLDFLTAVVAFGVS
jgi:hypothetical protein